MKIKSNYVLREIGDQFVVVPIGEEAIKFNGIITLNNSGKFLFKQLQEDKQITDLVEAILDKYEVSEAKASKDVQNFINILKENDLLE
ncbi:MAG: PqqD family protein [Tenericutes bacterium]|nr:PqqD family protein [Mycoplasmatota bacterium]